MLTDLQLGDDGDILISDEGELTIIEDDLALRQRLYQRLRIELGTWFLDNEFGIPYLERVMGKRANVTVLNAVFYDAIMATPGVSRLAGPIEYDFDSRTRILKISFSVVSETGEIIGVVV